MNERGHSDPPPGPPLVPLAEFGAEPIQPPWIERTRPKLFWLIPLLLIAAVLLEGLPFGSWRSVPEMLRSTDARTLIPGMRLNLESLWTVIPRGLATVAFAALIGFLTWVWRAGTPGFGFFAATAAFVLSLTIEFARWFKPGQLPDFRDPLIAAAVAPIVWRLLRRLPDQPVTPLPLHSPCGTRRRILLWFLVAGVGLGVATVAILAVPAIDRLGYAPAQIADLITSLPEGRTGLAGAASIAVTETLEGIGVAGWLQGANRLDRLTGLAPPAWTGAGPAHDGVLPPGRLRPVATIEALRQAAENAEPGDVILLQPGVYPVRGRYLTFWRPGTAAAPITVRAPRLGLVTFESDQPEALKVQGAHWRFENLVLRGVCADDTSCDNAFHIVGGAEDTVLRNLRIEDFNAQIKINGEKGHYPDHGRIAHTTLIDTRGRNTVVSVTPIDLVGANDWLIEDNLIADFVKLSGNAVSYGAFAKGDAKRTIFTRNVVLCDWNLRGAKGQTIGLSFGGGGTGGPTRRDLGRSGYEHADGLMTDNLIAFCSDDGIYLNRSANSVLRHNTLIATAGIDVRYPESTAELDANVVDGAVRAREDGLFWGEGNVTGSLTGMFLARNPVRALFVDPGRLDLRWKQLPEFAKPDTGTDLCGAEWTETAPPGAFQDFRVCGREEKSSSNP
jgi:parallel beta-helix repeat protein